MLTNSYFEYVLSLLGWIINNGLWQTLTQTGIFALPFLFKLIAIILKAREQGEDEGNKAQLTVNWLENHLYTAIMVMMFAGVPFVDIDINTVQYDITKSKQCGYSVIAPQKSGYKDLVNEIGGQTAAVPLWWYFVHSLSKGVLYAANATLPCQPDLRQIRFEVQHTRISDPALVQEIHDFVGQCYNPSYARLKRNMANKTPIDENERRDIDWIGSYYFLNTSGYYDTDRAQTPRLSWPYNNKRDAGLHNAGTGGYPDCKTWWNDKNIGIKDRVFSYISPTLWQRIKGLGQSEAVYKEALIRTLVKPSSLQVSQGGQVYMGYGGNVDATLMNTANRLTSTAGNALGSIMAYPAFDNLRQALPIVQSMLLFAFIVCLPIVMLFSAYDMKVIVTLSFVQFSLIFLTFWWEVGRWLDSWLMYMLYDSETHSSWNVMGIQNTSDDLILNLVMGTMFLVLPTFFLGALSWAGIRLGNYISNANDVGTKTAQNSGGKMAGKITRTS